jgi:hypothetical protein
VRVINGGRGRKIAKVEAEVGEEKGELVLRSDGLDSEIIRREKVCY